MQLNFVKRWSAHRFVRGAGIILGQGGHRRANLAKKKRTSKVPLWEYRALYSSTLCDNCFSHKFCLLIACLISVLSYQRLESKFLHIKRGYLLPLLLQMKSLAPLCLLSPVSLYFVAHVWAKELSRVSVQRGYSKITQRLRGGGIYFYGLGYGHFCYELLQGVGSHSSIVL